MLTLTRILPTSLEKIAVNPEQIVWMQPRGQGAVLYMTAGPEVEVREAFDDLLKFIPAK